MAPPPPPGEMPRLVFADYGPIIASIRALPQPSDSSTWEPATPVPWHCFSGRSGPEWAAAPGPFLRSSDSSRTNWAGVEWRHERTRHQRAETPRSCACCGAKLTPGTGDFYVVRIEALANPSPPRFSEEDLKHDHRAEIERLIEADARPVRARVEGSGFRRLILHLCGPCYRQWIEDPVSE